MLNLFTAAIAAFERAWNQRASPPVLEDPYARHPFGPVLGFALRTCPFEWLVTRALLIDVVPASMVVDARARYKRSRGRFERTGFPNT